MKFLSLVILFLCSFLSYANSSLPSNPHIAIEGKAKVDAMPDIAIISFEVRSHKATSLEAKKEIDEKVNKFLSGLNDFGIDESNISASSISTEPHYTYLIGEPKSDGFDASRNLKVTLKNINKLSSFVDFALKSKINELQNIELTSSKIANFKKQVNELAIQNAKEKGASLAKAFGAKLGKIYSINTYKESSKYGYGRNGVVVEYFNGPRVRLNKPGKYLQENITFSASINVVFDLDVK